MREVIPHSEKSNTAVFLTEVTEYVLKLQRALKEANPILASTLGIPMSDIAAKGASSSSHEDRGENNAAPAVVVQPDLVEIVEHISTNACSSTREGDPSLQPRTPPASLATTTCCEPDRNGCVSSKRTLQKHAPTSSASTSDCLEDEAREYLSAHSEESLTPSHSSSSFSQLIDSTTVAPAHTPNTPSQPTVLRPVPIFAVRRTYGSAFQPVAYSPFFGTPPQVAPLFCNKRMRTYTDRNPHIDVQL
eukprot:5330067-Pyramimonas_sp.AAC.1